MDATDSWWHFGAGPPGLTNQPPRIPENLRGPGPVEGQQPVADRMRETYGRALGVNLEVSDAGQTGRMDEQEEHQVPTVAIARAAPMLLPVYLC